MNKQFLNFGTLPESEMHQCEAKRKGDWIIWTCPQCEGYERRLNWVTKEMKSFPNGSTALHTGWHLPTGISPDLANSMN